MYFQSVAHMLQLNMTEYRQIRDEQQNCFCGIVLIGILGKDFGNQYIYVYIYVYKTVPKSSDSLRVIKNVFQSEAHMLQFKMADDRQIRLELKWHELVDVGMCVSIC